MTGLCNDCGADLTGDRPQHAWIEGDCVLQHRNHSRRLIAGTHVCEPCVERWDVWLDEIRRLWDDLPTVYLAGSVSVDDNGEYQKPRKALASPSPLRLQAWALGHPEQLRDFVKNDDGTETSAYLGSHLPNIPHLLANWSEAVYDARGWGDGWPTYLDAAIALIRANRETLAGIPDVDTFDTELRWIRRSLRTAHGISDPRPLFACISVDCGGHVWKQETGAPRCERCARRYGTLDIVRARAMQERETA